MWGLGCLIWEIFNGTLTQSSNLKDTSKVILYYIEILHISHVL